MFHNKLKCDSLHSFLLIIRPFRLRTVEVAPGGGGGGGGERGEGVGEGGKLKTHKNSYFLIPTEISDHTNNFQY